MLKNDNNTYSLSETGRRILAPTYEGEKEEGIKKALFIPSVLSRFYTDYDGSPIHFSFRLDLSISTSHEKQNLWFRPNLEGAYRGGALSSEGW